MYRKIRKSILFWVLFLYSSLCASGITWEPQQLYDLDDNCIDVEYFAFYEDKKAYLVSLIWKQNNGLLLQVGLLFPKDGSCADYHIKSLFMKKGDKELERFYYAPLTKPRTISLDELEQEESTQTENELSQNCNSEEKQKNNPFECDGDVEKEIADFFSNLSLEGNEKKDSLFLIDEYL